MLLLNAPTPSSYHWYTILPVLVAGFVGVPSTVVNVAVAIPTKVAVPPPVDPTPTPVEETPTGCVVKDKTGRVTDLFTSPNYEPATWKKIKQRWIQKQKRYGKTFLINIRGKKSNKKNFIWSLYQKRVSFERQKTQKMYGNNYIWSLYQKRVSFEREKT